MEVYYITFELGTHRFFVGFKHFEKQLGEIYGILNDIIWMKFVIFMTLGVIRMDDEQKCEHIWRSSGVWDGRTSDGKRAGGIMYKCDKCGEKVQTMEQIKSKGGSVVQGTDIFGRPKKDKESDFVKNTIVN